MAEVEHVLKVGAETGEGPIWDDREQVLYFVDIPGQAFHRYNPATGEHTKFGAGFSVGTIGLTESGRLILATKRGIALWNPADNKYTFLADPEADRPHMRFNDGKVDPQGRFWAGSMADKPLGDADGPGKLFRFDPDGSLHVMAEDLRLSNGLGWSPDHRTFYLTETHRLTIFAYDYDADSGSISNRRVFMQLPTKEYSPDGLTIDSEGYVWGACWGGAKVRRFAPDGTPVDEIHFPTDCTSCPTFGGPNLDEMYITTATSGLNNQQILEQPQAGDLFRYKPGVKGLPTFRFDDSKFI